MCLCARTGDTEHGERGGRASVSGAFPQVGRRRATAEGTCLRTRRDSTNYLRNLESGWNSARVVCCLTHGLSIALQESTGVLLSPTLLPVHYLPSDS